MSNFETIETEDLDNVTGGRGNIGPALRKAGAWAWRNVIAPAGGGAIYNWAADRLGGGQQPQQPAQPPAQPPAQQ
jgi:hypothetical protein